ncbi:MAG: SpoIIE family protein phosphatase [bacterium]|nr:SpoIIE family protein phosphatase [bacterium]
MRSFLIFLVDDDPLQLKVLETQFKDRTLYQIKTFTSGKECLDNLWQKPGIVVLDYYLNPAQPAYTGLKILKKIKATHPEIHVLMLSSQDRIEVAVNCMRHDAFDYIIKSEAAFMRIQKAITLLFNQQTLEDELVYYKTSSSLLEKMVEERIQVIDEQRQIIDQKHKEITDSINYAEHIQRSFLPSNKLLDDNLKEHFVFYQPKDVVSGDFYWASKMLNDQFMFLTADSTGHGVPGAIMSILNISCVEKAIEAEKLTEPSDILNHARLKIIETLKHDGSRDGGRDGMDCSLIAFDFANKSLTYAAANNPVWIVRDKVLIELLPNKMPVGKHDNDKVQFTQKTIGLQKNDVVYATTDGMPDQFGGPKGKKFMKKQLKKLLVSMAHLSMAKQKEKLSLIFNKWKANLEQVDDVTVVGIRI